MKTSPMADPRRSTGTASDLSPPDEGQACSGSARWRSPVATIAVLAALATHALAAAAASRESAFAEEIQAAMDKMMSGMEIRRTGDVDRDFAAMMIAHHQGAIDMAVAELRHGSSEPLRRLAQEIVVAQQQEIAVMRLALEQPAGSSARTAR